MSPIPRDQLLDVLRPFGESSMLPAAAYIDPDVLAWEQRHLFDGGWVCVGRGSEIAEPRSQKAVRVGASSVLLTRGDDGELWAMANICRHRGHELLPCGATNQRGTIICPYHAWVYELDGSLRNAPKVDCLDNEQMGLVPVRSSSWGGWVFVNVDGQAPSFDEYLGEIPTLLANWDLDQLQVAKTHQYELQANWKLACENYHECYHCPLIHPELCRVTVANSGDNYRDNAGAFVGGTMILADHAQTMSISGASPATIRPRLTDEQRRQVLYLNLFPNLLLSVHPDYALTHRIEAVAPGVSRIECQWLFDPADLARPDFDPSEVIELWDITNRQDWGAVESVQRNMTSPMYAPGVLAHGEDAVYQFAGMVANAYLGNGLTRGAIPDSYVRR